MPTTKHAKLSAIKHPRRWRRAAVDNRGTRGQAARGHSQAVLTEPSKSGCAHDLHFYASTPDPRTDFSWKRKICLFVVANKSYPCGRYRGTNAESGSQQPAFLSDCLLALRLRSLVTKIQSHSTQSASKIDLMLDTFTGIRTLLRRWTAHFNRARYISSYF